MSRMSSATHAGLTSEKNTKENAARLYQLAKGDNASTEMLELISGSKDLTTARAFQTQFEKDTELQFAGKCNDCMS